MEFGFFKLTNFFAPTRGNSKYTKSYGNKNKGKYPVYSASTNLPLTYINNYDYDGDYLTWSTNGFGGFLKLLNGKFSINGDRGILIPKEKGIDLGYIKLILQPILRDLAKGRKGEKSKNEFTKVSLSVVEEVEIPFPVNEDGELDLDKQIEIAEKYNKIEEIKRKLRKDYEEIKEVDIDVSSKYKVKFAPVTDIFNLEKGNPKYTKKYMHHLENKYPVYSSQTTNLGQIGGIDTYDYDEECFTWTTDGTYVGTVFYRKGKFSITTHCGILRVKKEYKDKIDFKYFKIILNQTLPNYKLGEGSNKRLGTQRMKEVEIPFPVNEDGELDLDKQIEIAEKYNKIEEIKRKLRKDYEEIKEVRVKII